MSSNQEQADGLRTGGFGGSCVLGSFSFSGCSCNSICSMKFGSVMGGGGLFGLGACAFLSPCL